MLKIAADLNMSLKKAGDFKICAAKAKKYLNEKNQNLKREKNLLTMYCVKCEALFEEECCCEIDRQSEEETQQNVINHYGKR